MEELKVKLKQELEGAEVSEIDGIRLELEEGWLLVRPSGTEPYIRVTAEGKTEKNAAELAERAIEALKRIK
jgi:phosphomannomutase